jgi:hypothetical protein
MQLTFCGWEPRKPIGAGTIIVRIDEKEKAGRVPGHLPKSCPIDRAPDYLVVETEAVVGL